VVGAAVPVVVGAIVVVGMVVVCIVVDGFVVVWVVCGADVEDGFMVDGMVEVDGSTVDVGGCKVDVGRGLTKVVVVAVVWLCWFIGVGFSVVVGKEDEVVGGEDEVKVVV